MEQIGGMTHPASHHTETARAQVRAKASEALEAAQDCQAWILATGPRIIEETALTRIRTAVVELQAVVALVDPDGRDEIVVEDGR